KVLLSYDYSTRRPFVDSAGTKSYLAHIQQAFDRLVFVRFQDKSGEESTVQDMEKLGRIMLIVLAVGVIGILVLSVLLYAIRHTFFFSIGETIRYAASNLRLNWVFFAVVLMLRLISYVGSLLSGLFLRDAGDMALRTGITAVDFFAGTLFTLLFIRF